MNPAPNRYRINEPYSELDSVIVDDNSVNGNSIHSRRSNQQHHYYDINDINFKPLYQDRPIYSVPKNVSIFHYS